MRILVTGASGFLGSHIVDELVRHDVEVVAFALDAGADARLQRDGVTAVAGDIRDPAQVTPLVQAVDFVVNAARLTRPGLRDEEYEAVNVGGVTNLLDAAREASQVKGLVQVSSTAVYGRSLPQWPVDESWSQHPRDGLERSLAMAERAARTYRRRTPLVVLRSARAFGARDRGPVMQFLLHHLLHSRAALVGGGRAPVSMAYGPDIGRAVWAVLVGIEQSQDRIFHVKSFDTDWRTLLEEGFQLLQRRAQPRPVPYRLALLWAEISDSRAEIDLYGRPHLVDDSRLRATVGFTPLFGLRAALRQTFEWLREERAELGL